MALTVGLFIKQVSSLTVFQAGSFDSTLAVTILGKVTGKAPGEYLKSTNVDRLTTNVTSGEYLNKAKDELDLL